MAALAPAGDLVDALDGPDILTLEHFCRDRGGNPAFMASGLAVGATCDDQGGGIDDD